MNIKPSAQSSQPPTRPGRFRARLIAGLAAGVLMIAAPAATAAAISAPASAASSTVSAAGLTSTLPTSITMTTRRTGSVIL